MDKPIRAADTLLTLGTNPNTGLASADAAARLLWEGANVAGGRCRRRAPV
jgi:hypothetical protein